MSRNTFMLCATHRYTLIHALYILDSHLRNWIYFIYWAWSCFTCSRRNRLLLDL